MAYRVIPGGAEDSDSGDDFDFRCGEVDDGTRGVKHGVTGSRNNQSIKFQTVLDATNEPHFREQNHRKIYGKANDQQSFVSSTENRHHPYSDRGNPNFNKNESINNKKGKRQEFLARIPDFQTRIDREWAFGLSRNLKAAWEADSTDDRKKFMEILRAALQECVEYEKNVMALGLFLMINCNDFTAVQGRTEALAIGTGLQAFTRSLENLSGYINEDMQLLAFHAAVHQKKQNLMEVIFDVYQLSSPERKNSYLSEIENMCKNKEFKEACLSATYLNLHHQFDVHAFLIPLLLQDRFNVVEEHMKNHPELQQNVVKYLDGLFDFGNSAVCSALNSYVRERGIPEVRAEKLQPKPISKLVKRLVSKYNISFDHCPNVGNRQRYGELRVLFSRKYEKHDMNTESFEELIYQIADANQKMQEEIIYHYMMYADYQAAARFITAHKLYDNPSCFHNSIAQLLPEPHRSSILQQQQQSEMEDECWDEGAPASHAMAVPTNAPIASVINEDVCWDIPTSNEPVKLFYMYPLARTSIHLVESAIQLKQFCDNIYSSSTSHVSPVISGFDSEWKPILTKMEGAALLQIAFISDTFIVDIISIKGTEGSDRSHWSALRTHYFENKNVIKLGFDVKNDVKMLTNTVPEWKGMNQTWKSLLDLSTIKTWLLKEDPKFLKPTRNASAGESGLSELVYLCLGKSVSKAEQMSDWEKRPLRESQVLYAAGDAFCLIEVYNAIMERKDECRVNVEKLIQDALKSTSAGSVAKKKKAPSEIVLQLLAKAEANAFRKIMYEDDIEYNYDNISQIKLVCDNMFQGLGRHLRAVGFDTLLLTNADRHSQCSAHAAAGRIVVTQGVAYASLIRHIPGNERSVLNIKSEKIDEQIQEICNQFKVNLMPEWLFAICQRCNTSNFIKVSPNNMRILMDMSGVKLHKRKDIVTLASLTEKVPDDMILCTGDLIKHWTVYDKDVIQMLDEGRIRTQKGVSIELNKLQPSLLDFVDWFYVCCDCGKCYWESSKIENNLRTSIMKEISSSNEDVKTE